MEFCDYCNNMYYIKENDDNSIEYYCKNCGSKREIKTDTNSKLILENNYEEDNQKYFQFLNPFIIHDHTIPHVNNVQCKNKECTKPTNTDNDVMYIKYDEKSIKFVYYCVHCKYFWT